MSTCKVEGCNQEPFGGPYCKRHRYEIEKYGQIRTLGSPTEMALKKYIKTNGGKITFPMQSACSAYHNATQSIPNNTYTKLQLNTENYDIQGEFDNATNYRFTATKAGKYLVIGQVGFDSPGDNVPCIGRLYKNGGALSVITTVQAGSTKNVTIPVPAILDLSANDYIELWGFQNSGGAVNTIANYTRLDISKIA